MFLLFVGVDKCHPHRLCHSHVVKIQEHPAVLISEQVEIYHVYNNTSQCFISEHESGFMLCFSWVVEVLRECYSK